MPAGLREEFRLLTEKAELLHNQLSRVTGLREQAGGKGRTGKLDHSQPPWNAPAAQALLELHAWTRMREAEWRRSAGFAVRKRGGSDENTRRALSALCALSHSVDDGGVAGSLRELARWTRQARVVLGELELPRRLPRQEGQAEPSCPYCRKRTLRMQALRGIVRCVDPSCRDSDGRRPVARMEWSTFTVQLELIWSDGVTGLVVHDEG